MKPRCEILWQDQVNSSLLAKDVAEFIARQVKDTQVLSYTRKITWLAGGSTIYCVIEWAERD